MDADLTAPLFEGRGLERSYRLGDTRVQALRGCDVRVGAGELVVLVGPSGSGKTTLLNLLGGLDLPDAGSVTFASTDWTSAPGAERTRARRDGLGFVFQGFNLVPVLSARENVEYPLWLQGVGARERRARALASLESVGLGSRADHRPAQLSGGEQQRVAVARALVHGPKAVLADEPTASLDTASAAGVLDLLQRARAERGTTIVVASHDPAVVARATRTIRLRDGAIVSEGAP